MILGLIVPDVSMATGIKCMAGVQMAVFAAFPFFILGSHHTCFTGGHSGIRGWEGVNWHVASHTWSLPFLQGTTGLRWGHFLLNGRDQWALIERGDWQWTGLAGRYPLMVQHGGDGGRHSNCS